MESILNCDCSMFANAKKTLPETINLMEWLKSTKYLPQQQKVRDATNLDNKRMFKEQMPCITPSGVFSQRGEKYLLQHTRLIAIDIDLKDNLHIHNFKDLKDELSKISNVAYCGKSVSGNGYWALIVIAYPEKHGMHFTFIQSYLKSKGISIDAACKDVCRLRFYSYDPDAYYNHAATPLQALYQPPKATPRQTSQRAYNGQGKPVWEQYNESTDFIRILENQGWRIESQTGNKTYFTRPGKTTGVSAEYDSSKNVFYVFTSSGEPFESGKGYSPFQVYTILEHAGDGSRAAKALMQTSKRTSD